MKFLKTVLKFLFFASGIISSLAVSLVGLFTYLAFSHLNGLPSDSAGFSVSNYANLNLRNSPLLKKILILLDSLFLYLDFCTIVLFLPAVFYAYWVSLFEKKEERSLGFFLLFLFIHVYAVLRLVPIFNLDSYIYCFPCWYYELNE
jgi:hypothetical protein